MNPNSGLNDQIRRLRRRVRLLLVERCLLFGAAIGAVATAVVVVLSYRYDGLLNYPLWAGLAAVGGLAGGLCGLLRKLDDLTLAIAADARTDLKERLSTAVVVEKSGGTHEMEKALMEDARERIAGFDAKQVFRHHFGAPHLALGIALIVLLSAVLVPMLPSLLPKTRRQEVAVMKKEAVKLSKLAKELEQKSSPEHKDLKKLANRLQKLAWKMQTGRMTKKQAMLQMQRLTKDIKQAQDKLAKQNSGEKPMRQAQREMMKASDELAKKMAEKLAKKENIPLEEALKKMSNKRMAELARKQGPLSESEQRELEQQLAKYADPNNQLPIPSELGEALAKLAQNKDYQKAAEMMQKLAQKLNLGKMSQTDREALRKQMEALAKSLKGTDLDKLAKAMLRNAQKLANMSPAELKKLLRQLQEMQTLAKAGGT